MVKMIVDAIIDNYERKLDDMRRELHLTSTALSSANAVRDEAVNKEVDLLKQVTQLERELASAQVDRDTARSHTQAALACIPVEDVPSYDKETRDALLDALFYAEQGTHIDALAAAITSAEAK